MRLRASDGRRAWAPAGLLTAVLALAALAATGSSPSRDQILSQIGHPAVSAPPDAATRGHEVVIQRSGIRVGLQLRPNSAGRRDWISVDVSRRGVRLTDARVTVTYSMPAMKMWRVLTSQLAPTRSGAYAASQPALGMAGMWQLGLTVAPARLAVIHLTINDRMGA